MWFCYVHSPIHYWISNYIVVENRFRKGIHFTIELLNLIPVDIGNGYLISY